MFNLFKKKENSKDITYFLTLAYKLSELQEFYIKKLSNQGDKTRIISNLGKYYYSIKKANELIINSDSFYIDAEIEKIRKMLYESEAIRVDWIFILQETSLRMLNMIHLNDVKFNLKKHIKSALKEGEEFNSFVRKEVVKLEKLDNAEYEEAIDNVSDTLTDLLVSLR